MSDSAAYASVKTLRFRSQRFETWTRQERAVIVGMLRALDGVHRADVRDLIDAEQERVQNGEEHRHHTEADPDSHHDRACGQRRPPEGAQGVLDVTDCVVDECGPALVAAFVGGQRRRSEARLRPPARLSRGQAFVDQFLRLALDVERELIVQLLLDAVPPEQRARPQCQVVEIHGVSVLATERVSAS